MTTLAQTNSQGSSEHDYAKSVISHIVEVVNDLGPGVFACVAGH